MKAKFTKVQLGVMALLGVFALLLIGGVFLLRLNVDTETGVDPSQPPHEKMRTARASLSPYFNREINIGGSGDETLCEVFTDGKKLYILGTTTSKDKDFDGKGGAFLAVVNADGSTDSFYQYGSENCSLKRAAIYENGFLLGVNDENGGHLYAVGYDGKQTADIDVSGVLGERIEDVKSFSSQILVVTSVKNTAVDSLNLKARVFDEDLKLSAERMFTHACSMEYLETFSTENGFVTVVNLSSAIINRMAFIDWGLQKQGLLYDIDLGVSGGYRCESVLPYDYGYFAVVIDSEKLCDIITISSDFKLHSRVFLKQSAAESADAFYAPDGYYCFISHGESLSAMLALDKGLQQKNTVPQFSTVKQVFSHSLYNASAVFCGVGESGIKLVTQTDSETVSEADFGLPSAENIKTERINGRLVTVCDMSGTGSDCPSSFGGRDIWLAFML